MPHGMCLLVSESGLTYGVRVDDGGTWTHDVTIEEYEQQGIQPPWEDLDTCPGMGPKNSNARR